MSVSCVHIQAHCHRSFAELQPVPAVVPWFSEYCEGLLSPFGLQTDPSRLENGANNDFLAMGRAVIRPLQHRSALKDISLFLMAHQTLDTYYPFRSNTTRLCREFDISAPAIGLTEQELSSPYIALMTLLAAFREGRSAGSGLLLILDQGTLPYTRPGYPASVIDNALALTVSGTPNADSISMSGKRYWVEARRLTPSWIVQSIYAYLDEQRINLRDVHVVVDGQLDPGVAAELPAPTTVADARLMSSAGLVATLNLLNQGSTPVLLSHLSRDGHLYLFLFSVQNQSCIQGGASCSI
ncbi:MAG TPA: hypothetical protein VLC92_21760 [Rhodocyclaceae bacterium]|nr:hypothetical protein [Rhodocyclaceae bacterium]